MGQPQTCAHQPGSVCPTGTCILVNSSQVGMVVGCHCLSSLEMSLFPPQLHQDVPRCNQHNTAGDSLAWVGMDKGVIHLQE